MEINGSQLAKMKKYLLLHAPEFNLFYYIKND